MKITRKKTRQIKVGNLTIGAPSPISVQSMVKTRIENIDLLKSEICQLQEMNCEIIRIAIPDKNALQCLKTLKKENVFNVPVVADVHYNPSIAVDAIKAGADCVRINPGNMGALARLEKIVFTAKEKNAAIRIGVNSGSIEKKILKKNSGNIIDSIVESVMEVVNLFENMGFYNFKISAKASSVMDTITAYEKISSKTNYPLHIGITEAGPLFAGSIKSAAGIAILLSRGIGDTIRVSLTDKSIHEVRAAYTILSSLNIRSSGVNIISCPTCSRTRVDLKGIVNEVEDMTEGLNLNLKIAVMGCVVNGPGEAKDSDIGIAYGIKKAAIFLKGRVIKRIEVESALKEFYAELKNIYKI